MSYDKIFETFSQGEALWVFLDGVCISVCQPSPATS